MNMSFDMVKPHVLNFLRQHYWKVQSLMDWEDAVAEAQLQFVRTLHRLQRSGSQIENEKHLMALFKTSWSRHFITLANKATKERFVSTMPNGQAQELAILSLIGEEENLGFFAVEMTTLPRLLRRTLLRIASEPSDAKQDEFINLFRRNKEQFNIEMCNQLGVNPQTNNIPQLILDHFGTEL